MNIQPVPGEQKILKFEVTDKRKLNTAFVLALLGLFGIACGIVFLTKLKKIDKQCECKIVADVNIPVVQRLLTPSTTAMRKQSAGVDTARKNSLELPIHQRLHHDDKN